MIGMKDSGKAPGIQGVRNLAGDMGEQREAVASQCMPELKPPGISRYRPMVLVVQKLDLLLKVKGPPDQCGRVREPGRSAFGNG